MKFLLPFVLISSSVSSANGAKVLVFGDSQGDIGPTYRVIEDVLNKNGVANVNVKNSAIGGTLGCDWAEEPNAVADAATLEFGSSGPDYVWLTVGGNDMASDDVYHDCLSSASTDVGAKACLKAASDRAKACTVTLLEGLWSIYPNAKVGMYNYEVPDVSGECLEEAANFLGGQYCLGKGSDAVGCMISQLEYWQKVYVDELQKDYVKPKFTGMNVLGSCQKASGVPGAEVGSPVKTAGSKSEFMTSCVHPTYKTPTATAIGEEIWKQWLKAELGSSSDGGNDSGSDNGSDSDNNGDNGEGNDNEEVDTNHNVNEDGAGNTIHLSSLVASAATVLAVILPVML